MAKYLVTGGNGYLAQQLVNLLLLEGHSVRVVDIQFDQLNVASKYSHRVDRHCFSLADKESLLASFSGIDICYHLASPASGTLDYNMQASAILDGLHVFHAAIASNNVPVIFSSTDSVYGPNISSPLFESAQLMPISSMGVHKLSLEHHARVLGLSHGLNTTAMRIFNVYGLWRGTWESDVISQFCRCALSGKEIVIHGNGDQVRDFIHVSDVARAFILVSKNNKLGFSTYNVCTGQATSLKNLIEMASSLLGYTLKFRYENKRLGDLYCAVGSNLKIKKECNFVPRITIRDGLRLVLKEAGAITLQKVM